MLCIHVLAKYANMSALQTKAEDVDPEKAKKAQERIQYVYSTHYCIPRSVVHTCTVHVYMYVPSLLVDFIVYFCLSLRHIIAEILHTEQEYVSSLDMCINVRPHPPHLHPHHSLVTTHSSQWTRCLFSPVHPLPPSSLAC